tara:strand:- start:7726 stop:9453 length:1728 start_codon:yes stop_codon:yes gene_type:complete
MKVFNYFWKFLNKNQKGFFFIIVFFSIVQAILEMIGIAAAIPFVTFLLKPESLADIAIISNFIDIDKININNDLIIIFCVIFFSIFLIKNIIIIFTNKIIYNFIFTFRSQLFSNLLTKILHQEFLFFVKKGISKIFNITFNEVNIFSVTIVKSLIILLSELLITFSIIFLIIISGNINGLIFTIPILFVVSLILKYLNRSIKNWAKIRIESNENIISSNLNLVNGIKEILIFGKIKNVLEQFNKSLDSLKEVDSKTSVLSNYPKILLEQSVILIFVLIILLMSHFGQTNDNIIITLSFYLAAAYRLIPSINRIFISYQQIKYGMPSIPKIMEYYSLQKDNKFFEEKIIRESLDFKKNIVLENFDFEYDHRDYIFKNLNFSLNKNEIIGISGESGTGKSTLINLVISLIKPSNGSIKIDGNELIKREEFRKYQNLFCISSQDSYLLDGSIKDNITFGSTGEISKHKIDEAIKFSRLEDTIHNLPQGIETQVGSTLKQLSSGQKQRISIARSIYNDREILIFDEATNALDEENEKIIFENIRKLKDKKTIIIISHNAENLKICDKVYLLKNKTLSLI